MRRSLLAVGLSAGLSASLTAQGSVADARCDSILNASHADTVSRGIFLSVVRVDGGVLSAEQAHSIAMSIGSAFTTPRPLRVSVFGGVARMRMLRSTRDTSSELRAPSLTGVYRVVTVVPDSVARIRTIRSSLIPELDSAAVDAIRAVSIIKGTFTTFPDDSVSLNIRFDTDSTADAVRLITARFPRVPVVDARPLASNPAAAYPEEAKPDSVAGEVLLRFVVARDGLPDFSTIEVVRGTYLPFIKSALDVLPQQRFQPATVNGCAVAQVLEYPFSFQLSAPPRH